MTLELEADGGVYEEEVERSSNSDDVPNPGNQGYPRNENGFTEDTTFHSEASSSAYHLRGREVPSIPLIDLNSSSDNSTSTPPRTRSHSKRKSGGSTVSIITPGESYLCSRCPKSYKVIRSLRDHIFSVHSKDPGVFTCGGCRVGYFAQAEFRLHLGYHRRHPEKSMMKCTYCSKVFNSKPARFRHQKMHLGRNGEVVRAQCEICQKSYGTFADLKKHQKKRHSQKQ